VSITSGWFDDEASSDVKVQLQGQARVLHCHRLMLSSWSDVWAAALEDKSQDTLDLTTYDAHTTKMCLRYCYSGDIQLTDDNLMPVHRFALCYHLQSLQSFCENEMQEQLTATNCLPVYAYLADIPSLRSALGAARQSVCENFVAICKNKSFYELSTHALCELLKSDSLDATEDDILEACCRWIAKRQPAVSQQAQEKVLQLVRFSQLSPKVLLGFKSHEMMKQSVEVKAHYQLSLEWRLTQQAGIEERGLRQLLEQGHSKAAFDARATRSKLEIDSKISDAHTLRRLVSMLGRSLATLAYPLISHLRLIVCILLFKRIFSPVTSVFFWFLRALLSRPSFLGALLGFVGLFRLVRETTKTNKKTKMQTNIV